MTEKGKDRGDVLVGVPLAAYCVGWFLWVVARFVEVVFSVSDFVRDFFVNIAAGVAVTAAAFALALWQGDRLAEIFTERRRLRIWRDVSRFCTGQITNALIQNMIGLVIHRHQKGATGLDLLPHDSAVLDPIELQYRTWARAMGDLLAKGAQLRQLADLHRLDKDDFGMIFAATFSHRIHRALSRQLDRITTAYSDALPTEIRIAIARVSAEIDFYRQQSQKLEVDSDQIHTQLAINLTRSAALFQALADLSRVQAKWHRDLHFEFEGARLSFGRVIVGPSMIDLEKMFDGPLKE